MYYIYHIKGVKIGCTGNAKRRVKEQGHTEYEILETHTDIVTASEREIQLQKEYGYEIDDTPYHISVENLSKGWNTENSRYANSCRKNNGHNTPTPIKVFKSGTIVGEYPSISEAGRSLSISKANITATLKGIYSQMNGYTFERA